MGNDEDPEARWHEQVVAEDEEGSAVLVEAAGKEDADEEHEDAHILVLSLSLLDFEQLSPSIAAGRSGYQEEDCHDHGKD